jgi:hypothetical protein
MLLLPSLSLWKVERLSRSTHRSEIRVEEQNGARVSKDLRYPTLLMLLSLSSKKIGPVALAEARVSPLSRKRSTILSFILLTLSSLPHKLVSQ